MLACVYAASMLRQYRTEPKRNDASLGVCERFFSMQSALAQQLGFFAVDAQALRSGYKCWIT